jgi:hypothetical protein
LAGLPPCERREKLDRLIGFAARRPPGLIISFRLRGGGAETFVKETEGFLLDAFAPHKNEGRAAGGLALADKVFLNYGAMFDWPRPLSPEAAAKGRGCLGLRHHFAILCSGKVVPCCADYGGSLALGDINLEPLSGILSSPAAVLLRDSIAAKTPMPGYCSGCGFVL